MRGESGSHSDSAYGEGGGAQAPPEACPWVYLASEPNVRAAYVTDAHRCELRQEIVPGPGHQLAYCMTANHITCPQLRSYEAQRQAGKPVAPGVAVPAASGDGAGAGPPAIEEATPVPSLPPPASGGRALDLAGWLGRGGSAALGALGAIVLLGALALLYASPGTSQTATPPAATQPSQPPPGTPAPAAPPAATPTAPPIPTAAPPAVAPAAPTPDGAAAAEETRAPTPEPTPAPAAPAQGGAVLVPYIVQPGDTLLIIAATYDVNLDELLLANELVFNSPIYHGQRLLLPIRVLSTP